MSKCVSIITGRVQAVGYRAFVYANAAQLGIEASATNMPDGTVIVEAQGERALLEALLELLRQGPPHANVERVDVVWRAH